MSLEDRANAVAKNVEGKIQEAAGDLAGDTKLKAEGQAKQAQASAIHSVENLKDTAKDIIDKA